MPSNLDLKLLETLKKKLSGEWKDRDDDVTLSLR